MTSIYLHKLCTEDVCLSAWIMRKASGHSHEFLKVCPFAPMVYLFAWRSVYSYEGLSVCMKVCPFAPKISRLAQESVHCMRVCLAAQALTTIVWYILRYGTMNIRVCVELRAVQWKLKMKSNLKWQHELPPDNEGFMGREMAMQMWIWII